MTTTMETYYTHFTFLASQPELLMIGLTAFLGTIAGFMLQILIED